MSYKIEALTKPLVLGEGPHWDIATQTLYFVDIYKGSVHSFKPSTNEYNSAVIGDGSVPVSLIIPVDGQRGKFLISIKNQLAVISWDGKSSTTSEPEIIATAEPQDNKNRINDGKCDPKGRLWAGTMGVADGKGEFPPVGSLYCLHNNNVKKHLGNIHIANGLAWTSDNKKLYYIDSMKYRIDSYDFDIENGTISNEKTVFDLKKNQIEGIPDGMTIDAQGNLYVATFNGGQILQIDPKNGKLLSKIPIPAIQTTSAAFGGPNLDELYVTSANLDPVTHKETSTVNGTNGCLFRITNLGVKGLPMTSVKL